MATRELDDAGFDAALAAGAPVLVDFWAPWCRPCLALAPALEELSEAFAGRVDFVKVNIDENQEAPARWGVRGVPTLILFRGGGEAARHVGSAPRARLEAWLEESLGAAPEAPGA